MKKNLPGVMHIEKTKTNSSPLALHDNAKENKYASPEFTHTEF